MEKYKEEFIRFLIDSQALKVFYNRDDDRKLKSARISPWFVNIGDFNDGAMTNALAGYYADAIIQTEENIHVVYGIPDKGVGLAAPVAMAMDNKNHNVGWFFSRKDEKTHGEATGLDESQRKKKLLVGHAPNEDENVCQLDDVFTAGNAKYEAREFLQSLGINNLTLLAIAVDRQEVGIDGKNAIQEYQKATGTNVISVVNAAEVYEFLNGDGKGIFNEKATERLANYLRVYGSDDVRKSIGSGLETTIINRDRSVIPACDVKTLQHLEDLVKATSEVDGIGAYKIGFELGLGYGLPDVVEAIKKNSDKPIIYDHQKAGTDIPDTGKKYARVLADAGVDATILFPQAGPETERAWIYHCLDHGLKVIVGGRMTHPAYSQSEGGFISDEGALEMYRIAAKAGVNHFVVPGNKPDVIETVKGVVESEGVKPVFYAPGFVAQGGKLGDAAEVAGERFHGIVGRGIYKATDLNAAAKEYTSEIAT